MSASHTDILSKAHKPQTDSLIGVQPHFQASALNLRDLLSQNPTNSAVSSSDKSSFTHPGVRSVLSGTSLAQLMPEHLHKSTAGDAPGSGVPSLSALTKGPKSSPSITSNQSSLSLGTLATLHMSSASQSSAPSLLSGPLSGLSLSSCKVTTANSSPVTPSGLSILTSAPSSSQHPHAVRTGVQAKMADPKGGPSLADLIQQHSKQSSSVVSNSVTVPQLNATFTKCQMMTAHAPVVSLSELASQHQNRNSHIQSQGQEQPPSSINFSRPTDTNPACLGGVVSLSQLALQHQQNRLLASAQPASADSPASAPEQLPGISFSHLASVHKSITSTTSNGSHYSLSSLLSPEKTESTGVLVESIIEDGTNRRPYRQDTKPTKLRHAIDLCTLMAQSDGGSPSHLCYDLPSLSRPAPVFAQPSVFAITLSAGSQGPQKRRRIAMEDKVRKQTASSGCEAFLCKSQDKSNEHAMPLAPIVPFRFDTPSPDDIVRANQRKAFTR